MYDNNSTKRHGGREMELYCLRFLHHICEVAKCLLKVNHDKIKIYTISPKATTKIIQQRVVVTSKPIRDIK